LLILLHNIIDINVSFFKTDTCEVKERYQRR